MTKMIARHRAIRRCQEAGLDEDTTDAVVSRALEVFHEEFTEREWFNFVDEEIARHANP